MAIELNDDLVFCNLNSSVVAYSTFFGFNCDTSFSKRRRVPLRHNIPVDYMNDVELKPPHDNGLVRFF